MEQLITQFSGYSYSLFNTVLSPLLVWTAIVLLFLTVAPMFNNLHAQYQYKLRLAALYALPAGLAIAIITEFAGSYFFPAETSAMKFVTVMAPIEIGISAQEYTAISFTELLFSFSLIILVTGWILMLGRYLQQWRRLYTIQKSAQLTAVSSLSFINRTNRELSESSGKKVAVGFTKRDVIPVTFGFRHPVVLLPDSLKHDPEKLNLALRHELIHITERDFISNAAVTLFRILFWFHPLVHLLAAQLADYREMRCDSFVLSDQKISRKAYASLLLELMPNPNLDTVLSVNMAQESSNLKQRIKMITNHKTKTLPKRAGSAIFATLLGISIIAMACTDMQTDSIFNEEELDLMTDVDRTGERGYHQILIFTGEEGQADRHQGKLEQLNLLKPEHIQSVEMLTGEAAIRKYGSRAENGVIVIHTQPETDSYNKVLELMGMEVPAPPSPPAPGTEKEDFFVVVEDMPQLIGGLVSIQQEIRYPEMARRAGIEGRVYIQFIVNEQGDVENPQVIRGIGGGADEEALRVVKQAKFRPGLQRGQPVRVQYSLPIVFRLQGNNSNLQQNSNSHETSSSYINPEDYGVVQKELNINITNRSNSIVHGVLTDKENGNPVGGANIHIPGTNRGAVSDHEGNFNLRNVSPDDELVISHVSYQTVSVSI